MFTVRFASPRDLRDLHLAELQEAGTLGILEHDDGTLEAWFDSVAMAARFGAAQAALEHDWQAEFESRWFAREVGARLWVAPPWLTGDPPAGRVRLDYRPGMACGTGEHAATRLALTALDALLERGDRLLDVGCGSGLLTQAALLLGARYAIGCDIEFADTRIARETTPGAEFFVGSARAIRAGAVDVTVANINAEVLLTLAGDLLRVTRRHLILSGFEGESLARLTAAFGAPARRYELEGWTALAFRL